MAETPKLDAIHKAFLAYRNRKPYAVDDGSNEQQEGELARAVMMAISNAAPTGEDAAK